MRLCSLRIWRRLWRLHLAELQLAASRKYLARRKWDLLRLIKDSLRRILIFLFFFLEKQKKREFVVSAYPLALARAAARQMESVHAARLLKVEANSYEKQKKINKKKPKTKTKKKKKKKKKKKEEEVDKHEQSKRCELTRWREASLVLRFARNFLPEDASFCADTAATTIKSNKSFICKKKQTKKKKREREKKKERRKKKKKKGEKKGENE